MHLDKKSNIEIGRKISESFAGGVVIGTGVAVERLLNQGAEMSVVLSAGGIQAITTFCMALGSISLYDYTVKNFPGGLDESFKKLAIAGVLSSLSGAVNYIGQLKTQGSIEESVVMSGIAGTGLLVYELEIIPKIKSQIQKNKYSVLDTILNLGNTLGLR